jgi:hypothetical protein
MMFDYLKKGSRIGQRSIERDMTHLGNLGILPLTKKSFKNQVTRAKTNMKKRMDQKNLFDQPETKIIQTIGKTIEHTR